MAKNLTNQNDGSSRKGVRLTKTKVPFRLSIEHALDNKFGFKKITKKAMQDLHSFIDETVDKELSISDVDSLFLRKQGPKESQVYKGKERDILHYGKDRKPFRLFGYYNDYGYFVLTKIDYNHKTH